MVTERSAHVCGGAVTVVGKGLAQNGDTSGTVALIRQGFVIRRIFASAECFVDSGLNLVFRQRVALCLFNCGRQRRVVRGIRVAAFLRRNGDVAGKLAEQSGTLSVLCSLTMLRGSPFRMTGHACLFLAIECARLRTGRDTCVACVLRKYRAIVYCKTPAA